MTTTTTLMKCALSGAAFALATAVFGAANPAAAQKSYPRAVENNCRDDYFRYCSVHALGTAGLNKCMERNGKALSRGCQQALQNAGYTKTQRARRGS